MKITKKQIGIMSAVLLILSAAASVFRINVLNCYTNPVNGLYTNKTVGGVFFAVFAVLVILSLCVYFFAKKAGYKGVCDNGSVLIKTISVILGMAFAAMFAIGISSGSRGILYTLQCVLCVPSAVYFCAKGSENDSDKGYLGILSLFPAIWAGIKTISLFIDTTTQINASQRSFTLVLLVFTMMFFLSEAEFLIPLTQNEKADDRCSERAAKYTVLGLIVAELAIVVTVPGFITNFGLLSLYDVFAAILEAVIAVYAAVRVFSLK